MCHTKSKLVVYSNYTKKLQLNLKNQYAHSFRQVKLNIYDVIEQNLSGVGIT